MVRAGHVVTPAMCAASANCTCMQLLLPLHLLVLLPPACLLPGGILAQNVIKPTAGSGPRFKSSCAVTYSSNTPSPYQPASPSPRPTTPSQSCMVTQACRPRCRVVLWTGALLHLVGYLGLYAAVARLLDGSSVWLLTGCAALAGWGSAWLDTSALTTCLRNFPDSRGLVVGLCKGCLGLTASVYALLYLVGGGEGGAGRVGGWGWGARQSGLCRWIQWRSLVHLPLLDTHARLPRWHACGAIVHGQAHACMWYCCPCGLLNQSSTTKRLLCLHKPA